ncbi:tetratricopeptide repeat protein [uncultured Algibacter sp.]|uniref:tetratricopeptide repeat protein n=1 Tax=uncultured Algibacter sp. TaxID=298659 RepID=UPI003216A40C
MKQILTLFIISMSFFSLAQEKDKEQLLALKKANNNVYEGNTLVDDDFVSAEMAYRKALSHQPSSVAGTYNLGNSYYRKGNYDEALYRHQQAVEGAISKEEKHKAFHNIGNTFMQSEKYKEAVEAYKNALRNNPADEETRYNLAVAKKKQKEEENKQKDQNKDDKNQDKDNKDKDNKDNKDNKDKDNKDGDNKEDKDKKDKGDEDDKNKDKKKDEDKKPKDDKKDKGDGDKKKDKQQPKPQPGQLSPQQIKNLLEAMNNQEQKVQEKMNAEKRKGVKIKTEKDW